jgi:DNA-binding CsgD family transcriptional regulator
LRNTYGISNAVYHAVNLDGAPYAALTYTPEWMDHYQDRNYVRVDPVVRGALQHFHPMDWKRLDWSNRESRAFLLEAQDAGIGNQGISIPIRGPNGQFALFTVNHQCSDREWEVFSKEFLRDFLLISHYLHGRVVKVMLPGGNRTNKPLSPRETDALKYLALGNSRSQIAETLSISEHTLRVYIDSARHKLGALNTVHAVSTAFNEGLISL